MLIFTSVKSKSKNFIPSFMINSKNRKQLIVKALFLESNRK